VLVLVSVIASGQLSVDQPPSLSSSETIHIPASVSTLTALGLVVVLFAVAAGGFLRRSDRENDEFIGWMGAGCALAALASLSYMLFPPLNQSWFYTADLLRLGAYLMWLIGGAREIAGYWSELAQVAVTEERRRLARELHDGMAQELAFVTTQAASAARVKTDPTTMTQLGAAAQRALDESRRAIAALATDHDDPLETVLVNVTEEVAGRYGSKVRLDLDDSLVLPPKVREDLLWIVREAVTNAARHGKAREVTIEVRGGKPVSVCVRDNGCGFSPQKVSRRRGGFGLISMRERAEAIGAEFMISSTPFGTTVKIG
jgi:signal transduction histidine kinase